MFATDIDSEDSGEEWDLVPATQDDTQHQELSFFSSQLKALPATLTPLERQWQAPTKAPPIFADSRFYAFVRYPKGFLRHNILLFPYL